jgi:UPF0716 protein FxsA
VLLVVALCVIVPIVELVVFLQVAQWIGGWEALLLLLVVSLLGVWLVKAQGVAVYRQGRAELEARRVPGRSIVDGALIVVAGGLLIIPGFVTAILGLLLLIPPTRIAVREFLVRRWSRRVTVRRVQMATARPTVIRVDSVVVDRSDPEQLGSQRAIETGDEPLG